MSLLCFNRGKFGCEVAPIVAAVIVVSLACGLSSVIWVVFIDDEGFIEVSVVVVVIICDDDSLVAIVIVVEVAGVIGVVVVVVAAVVVAAAEDVIVAAAEDVIVALDIAADNFEFKSLE